ncbi:hypothetical protein M2451_002006, partial [Dysgonomonas sp. PFB1-18]|nr:hypothetical protein [Dysgonomonas sp. PF1-16]MDH6380681.1 hypothetical protein [Dysgonomonas sp. PFB1-18]MDH6398177.1 hypothetical protein [Dysgonomonas sp. PF1-23]
ADGTAISGRVGYRRFKEESSYLIVWGLFCV